MNTKASKEARARVDYTCPNLDAAMDDLLDIVMYAVSDYLSDLYVDRDVRDTLAPEFAAIAQRIKEQCTMPFREALIEACDEILELQSEVKELRNALPV